MAVRDDVQGQDFWVDDDPGDIMEMEEEEESCFEDFEEEGDQDAFIDVTDRYQAFSARRRIEIVREDKWLRSLMADFDDYDDLEDADGICTKAFSH